MVATARSLILTVDRVTKLVTHKNMDFDAWLCYWLLMRYLPQAADAELVLVNSGTSLEGSQGDPTVITFDTGHGQFDHHSNGIGRDTTSAHLLAQALEVNGLPELQELLTHALKVDRAEAISPTDINYQIKGWSYRLHNPQPGTPEWEQLREMVFTMFDIVRDQEALKAKTQTEFESSNVHWATQWGVRICVLNNRPQLRNAAFERGADVVVWSQNQPKGKILAGVQLNRNSRDRIDLTRVAAQLRLAEAKARGIEVNGSNLAYIGQGQPIPTWYLDQSLNLILAGSKTHKPAPDEWTRLTADEIARVVIRTFGELKIR